MVEDMPTLTQQDRNMLEGNISLDEASSALWSMDNKTKVEVQMDLQQNS